MMVDKSFWVNFPPVTTIHICFKEQRVFPPKPFHNSKIVFIVVQINNLILEWIDSFEVELNNMICVSMRNN